MKKLENALKIENQLINDIIFMCEARTKSTYFTRAGKMSFKNTLLFMLSFVKKSIQIELDSFIQKACGEGTTITKQGYAEARKKISPTAFIKLADAITTWYYGNDEYKTYRGYRLSAIDGTVLEVNNSERLRESFGHTKTNSTHVARALASCIYDVENDMILTSKIARYDASERDLAIELIEQLKGIGKKNELMLFDRGYPSADLISYLEKNEIKYLMRVTSSFFNEVNEAKEEDQVVEVKIKKTKTKIRVLKFDLESGEKEVLITNLFDEDLGIADFKALYFKRWGIEVKYNEIKNKLQVENFTGDTPLAVEQDFYASMHLVNLVAIAKAEADQTIAEKTLGKGLKYEYKVNTNILIGKLKDKLIYILLENNRRKRSKMLARIKDEISRNYIPIRPGRKEQRKMGLRSNKYSINQKKCL
jgi:hypothetical protein